MIKRYLGLLALSALCVLSGGARESFAAQVSISGDQQVGPISTEANGKFTFVNVPLRRNAVNKLTVTATDGDQVQTKELSITQLSLDSVVVSKIKAEPLSVQEIEQLVNDGVIDIDDPSNFNVSKFEIVLTIGRREVPISFNMVSGIDEIMGEENIPPMSDPGNGNSSNPNPPDIVIFEIKLPPSAPGEVPPPPIPGVLIIEGRIKTLKEFYSVRLLLLNTSGIFTLHDVIADIEFPDGGLSPTLPSDGIVQFGDILPGDGEFPGQKEREFIIRGDEIGIRGVRVNFGGTVIGPGIPDDDAIPFNGSAQTTVEVKGPPEFRVQVIHPPEVFANVPYELLVDITNVGETPALYTSFELDVGADGKLVDCVIGASGQPECTPIEGSAVRNIGHLLPGDITRQSFTINPLVSGPITSCMSVADQNIDLQVFVGAIGCLSGRRPPSAGTPDGIPTISVLPTANAFGLGIDTPVVAFFNERMNEGTLSTGAGGTFNVFDDSGNLIAGQLTKIVISDHTVAIWQPTGGPLAGNTTFTVNISQAISDLQGFTLQNPWVSEFTTTDPTNDVTPPTMTLAIEPPVNPNNVVPGEIIRLNAYASDQGTALARIEIRQQDTDVPDSVFQLIDQKTIFPTTVGPYIFSVDSSNLVAGHTYQFKATAFDNAGNSQDATIAAILAPSAAAPVIQMPADPSDPVLHGITVTVVPENVSGSVQQVDYYLDGAAAPFKTVTLAPFSATLPTLGLELGSHTIRAVATDGLDQTGQDTFNFVLAENLNEPTVDFGSSTDGAQYITGTPISINGSVEDPLGIQAVAFFLDNTGAAPIATTTEPFIVNTDGLSLGTHKLFFKATNKLGVSNDLNSPEAILEFEVLPVPPPAPPPAAPVVTDISFPVNSQVTVNGTSPAGSRIDITNLTEGLQASIFVNALGTFAVSIDADAGDVLRLVAVNLEQSATPSAPTDIVVPTPPVLDHIEASPASRTFTAVNQAQNISVTAFYVGGAQEEVTGLAVYDSNNSSIASVNSAGIIVGLANGNAVITVSFGGKQTQVSITVDIVTLTGISINPASFTLIGFEKTRQLEVLGNYSNGSTSAISNVNVVFASSSTGIATVGGSGIVTSKAAGISTVTATVSGFPSAQSVVTVQAIVATDISVSPNAILFTEADETRQLEITVELSDGNSRDPEGAVSYSSDDTSAATVTSNGLVTAKANGDATITVTHAGFTKTVTVVVDIPTVVIPPPEITAIDRPKAGEGDVFVIQGKNFAAVPGENTVLVNGLPALVQSSRQDELVIIVPKGASSGPVSVTVDGDTSNTVNLTIYPRSANAFQITPAIDMPAAPGAKLNLPGPVVDFRAGDKVYLSSAPDILAPLSFTGALRVKVGNSSFFPVSPAATATDISALFSAGELSVTVELAESGGRFRTAQIYLFAGPAATGPIAGIRSVMANGQNRPTPITFINLKDAGGNPLPDGSKVVVTVEAHCFRNPADNNCIASHGGSIANGDASPEGFGLKAFTVNGGRIDVIYQPETAPALRARLSAVSAIQVLPANASNLRTSNTALTFAPITLTSFDTVGTPRSQTSAIADGLEKIVIIKFQGARDTAGQPVPDGTPVIVTVQAHCFRDVPTNNCIPSAGGSILSGIDGVEGFGFRQHFITQGEIELQYSPGTFTLAYPDTAIANLQWLPSRPNSTRIDNYAFQITSIALSSAQSPDVSAPTSVFADHGDNRSVITFSNFRDSLGNPVPDGTKIVATAQAHCFRDPVTNGCIASAGGEIISGTTAPEGFGFKVHEIHGGQTQVTYSSLGVGMESLRSALVTVYILPARPDGVRIGNRALAVAPFTAVGYQTASVSANPSAVVADGLSKTVVITLSNIRDTLGNVVPDGSVILLSAQAHCFRNPADENCIPSTGGTIKTGTIAPEGFGFMAHVVMGGQVVAEYDPGSVLLSFPDTGTANIYALPARPNRLRIGNRAFAVVPVSLSSLRQAVVSIAPASILANGGNNLVQVTLTDIKDGAGNSVPNGTKIVATAQAHCFRHPVTNNCIDSRGGAITSGAIAPEGFGFQEHTITAGTVQLTYSAQPVSLEAREAATATIQVLPAQPSGLRIGNRAFVIASVTLAGYQSADITGAGQVAPNGTATYVVSNIRDTSGNVIPDGANILVTAQAHCFRDPDTGNCIPSLGGTITNGAIGPEGFGFQAFTIAGGQISVQFQAPGGTGTSVLQFMPANPSNLRIGNRAFTLKSVSVQS